MKNIIPTSWDMICPILAEYMTDETVRNLYPDNVVMYYDDRNFVDWSGYIVKDGVYKFYNNDTRIRFMKNYGITCGCERRVVDGKVKFFYNDYEMTKEQYIFLSKRASMLHMNKVQGCGCEKRS